MKLLIDDAHIDNIKRLWETYAVAGVTTNPSILANVGKDPIEVLSEIRAFIGSHADLHVQVIASDVDGILADAKAITELLGKNTFVKIPATPSGLKAMKLLTEKNIAVTATAIYTPMQAFLAAEAGASWVAPYVNRIDNMGYNGIGVAKEIQDIFDTNDLSCGVLAASFKNSQQVLELAKYGIAAATVSPDVIDAFVKNAAIDAAVVAFEADWETLAGRKSFSA